MFYINQSRRPNKQGSILIISLWVLAILSALAVSLTQRARANLRAAYYQKDALKAHYLAKGGVAKAIAVLNNDIKDYDTIDACGIDLGGRDVRDIFSSESRLSDKDGSFTVGYYGSAGEFVYGMRDEESKVNININSPNLNLSNFDREKIFALLELKEIADAEELSDFILSWISSDGAVSLAVKENLTIPEELLLPLEYFYQEKKGYSREEACSEAQKIYLKIADLITVYGDGKINVNTVSEEAFEVIALAVLRSSSDLDGSVINEKDDVGDLLSKIRSFRENNEYFTEINTQAIREGLGLADIAEDNKAKIIQKLFSLNLFIIASSNFRIESIGVFNRITKKINAVYDRPNKKIVYWHEN